MSETDRIADQFQRACAGPAWHGPSLGELLANVPAERAVAKPLPGVHSIWEIVLHVTAWQDVVCRRLAGETLPDLPPEQDWPAVTDSTPAAWRQTLDQLARSQERLREAMVRLPPDHLRAKVPGKEYSGYGMLHGVIQHDLYHAGQIAILKKAAIA
jgi:uncharacterized damage-inducible protein DinB